MSTQYDMEIEDPWFTYILQGVKTVEGRKGTDKWSNLKIGDVLHVKCKDSERNIHCRITRISKYNSLLNYIINEGLRHTLPGVGSVERAIVIYTKYWNMDEVDKYGVLGIELELIKTYEAIERVIGALVLSIEKESKGRSGVSMYSKDAVEKLIELCASIGKSEWVPKGDSFTWDYKTWKGPFGRCVRSNIESVIPGEVYLVLGCFDEVDY